ncbi:menaquinol-cytochrome c reductase cytochrome b/c subunit [Salsuginibacillus halophilus]|uniref:Menaquinol-cytochrome c reductase cytochrome b/c subunit n=1 Tax=Salsuginibacillus halophilus TaxID=517424 RepID=A0A2P8HW99_9BACI|nr:menaquinol-cytochrome c reductase cytochrome b/c subunit [Salsuginibacillus halophilus]PSL50512.1 menaquinol-cytochrome c reductase cytochrome b/c subunit [Salsuginibacillus halophilus]
MHRGKGMKFVGDSRVPAEKKPNIPKDYSEFPGKTEAFWPNFLLKEWLVGAVFLIGFLCMATAYPASLEGVADPTDSAYIPLPDWYFLFLYQLLKYQFASGDFELIGNVVIPGIAFGALLIAPWLDNGPERRPSRRPIATAMMMLGTIATIYLTWESVEEHDWEAAEEQGEIITDDDIIEVDQDARGYEIYEEQGCIECHGDQMEGAGAAGPDLYDLPYGAEDIAEIAVEGIGDMPAGLFDGDDEELEVLSEYIEANGQPDDGDDGEEDDDEDDNGDDEEDE